MRSIICLVALALLAAQVSAFAATTYNMNVTLVTCGGNSQPACPTGFGVNYKIVNGINNGAGLNQAILSTDFQIYKGDTITFVTDTGAFGSHPFSVCSATGATTPGCGGTYSVGPMRSGNQVVTVTFNTVGSFNYGCGIHPGFGAMIKVVDPAPASSLSICAFYTDALFGDNRAATQAGTITAVVKCAVFGTNFGGGNFCGTHQFVEGILNNTNTQGVNILRFFNGGNGNNCGTNSSNYLNRGGVAGCVDFVSGYPSNVEFAGLAGKLVSFFGTALGCNAPGYVPASQAGITANLYQVHYNMGITSAEFSYFNTQVINALVSYAGGLLRSNDGATASGFLGWFGKDGPQSAGTDLGFPAITPYTPTNPPTVGGPVGPAAGYEAICYVNGCPTNTKVTQTPNPSSPPGGSAPYTASYSVFVLFISAASIALVGLFF